MGKAVIRQTGYVLAHAPDVLMWQGAAAQQTRRQHPDEPWLAAIPDHLRTFDQAVNYPPNQCYIGNISPGELEAIPRPWLQSDYRGSASAPWGEIYSETILYALLCYVDAFELTAWQASFVSEMQNQLSDHPKLSQRALLEKVVTMSDEALAQQVAEHAEPLWIGKRLVGCVKAAHDLDINLSAHVMLENLVTKASAVLAGWQFSDSQLAQVEYVIECSEEAIGDVNQRGGGNLAKAVAESLRCSQATGIDMRGFCAGPVHALVNAAALVQSGVYKNVLVLAGGSVAKLGMNGRDHIKHGLPLLEDMLGGFALLISEDDGVSPLVNTHVTGRHTVGTGSSPQAVMASLISQPLKAAGMTTADVDKFSVELQNPEITQPAGAGNVPESNYKMIAALSVMEGWLERSELAAFVAKRGMPGFAPTQGHIPSGIPFIGHGLRAIADKSINNFMVVGKGSLFLGRMTSQFDGISVLVERNPGKQVPASQEENAFGNAALRPRIAFTALGSELPVDVLLAAAEQAADALIPVIIGPVGLPGYPHLPTESLAAAQRIMEQQLASGEVEGAVTLHYNFPLGVATVAQVFSAATGRQMVLASTTGSSDIHPPVAMMRNAVAGLAMADALGIREASVGILNTDGATSAKRLLERLRDAGYPLRFASSGRADGGALMRGNDLIRATPDVMVCDTLTGNLLIKLFSAGQSGGETETLGSGYGIGLGADQKTTIGIISRASGPATISNALRFCALMAKRQLMSCLQHRWKQACACGIDEILREGTPGVAPQSAPTEAASPPKTVLDDEIHGIDILQLEDAKLCLWQAGIYAETGMGCTGPVLMINQQQRAEALTHLQSYLN